MKGPNLIGKTFTDVGGISWEAIYLYRDRPEATYECREKQTTLLELLSEPATTHFWESTILRYLKDENEPIL